jgi:uncharacterized membrane protein
MSPGDTASTPTGPLDGGPPRELEPHLAALLRRRVARNINVIRREQQQPVGELLADTVAKGAGSWGFICSFLAVIAVWMVVNAIAGLSHWDPYPFILLNLALSCIAAIQAPIILMSQNREEARDRMRAEADYEVNLKAEVLLENLTQEVHELRAMLAREEGGSRG